MLRRATIVAERYQIGRKVDEELNTTTYYGQDLETGERVLIQPFYNVFTSTESLKGLIRLLKFKSCLNHPGISKIKEVIFDNAENPVFYVISTALETDLSRVIRSNRELSATEVCLILFRVLCVLRYLHA
jgi:mitogen-activated protein kinase 1/3